MAYKPNDLIMDVARARAGTGLPLTREQATELLNAYDYENELGHDQARAAHAILKDKDAEIERLRGLLAALVANTPYHIKNNWTCAYCDETNTHAPGCAWEQARRAVEEGERHGPTV